MHIEDLRARPMGARNSQLVEAWLGWRAGRMVPLRSDVDLRSIARELPWIGVLDVGDPGDVIVRIAGTALRDVHGLDMTGRSLREISRAEDWPTRLWRYRALVRQPCGFYSLQHDVLPDGRVIAFELVALPLARDAAGPPTQIICSLYEQVQPDEPPGAAPRHQTTLAQRFAFVDIGAGVPERTEPAG
jgi:hypothetical protein